jgi:hypothetical protein
MMANVLESVAVLGVVEAFVFDLLSALGHEVEAATAHVR